MLIFFAVYLVGVLINVLIFAFDPRDIKMGDVYFMLYSWVFVAVAVIVWLSLYNDVVVWRKK